MVVKHNLEALNANRMLNITTRRLNSSTERLSSGYKINRAADDAAGLSISEKMRKQIRGLTQASSNAEDGISCVQTAEGALNEVTDMLQRMNELVVQAANGTNSVTDRQYIQDELDQLITEVDRVAETTKFNEIYLLKGDEEKYHYAYTMDYVTSEVQNSDYGIRNGQPPIKYNYLGQNKLFFAENYIDTQPINNPVTARIVDNGDDMTTYLNTTATTINSNYVGFVTITLNSSVKAAGASVDANDDDLIQDALTSAINAARDLYIYDSKNNSITKIAAGSRVDQYLSDTGELKSGYRLLEKLDHARTTAELGAAFALDTATIEKNINKQKLYDANGKEVSAIKMNSYFDDRGFYQGGLFNSATASAADEVKATGTTSIGRYVTRLETKVYEKLEFDLHVGADSYSENKIKTSLKNLSASGLGINKIHSTSVGMVDDNGQKATDSIDVIAKALQLVSQQRSELGAIQNRLEHTILNLDNIVENTQKAESSIRDTDMAKEMVEYANNGVLSQAGTSMLSQANQSKQGILSLLQ